jgi:hypothetical protein
MNTRKQIKAKQQKINKIIKAINQNIANDNLWKGRFIAHQIDRTTGVWNDQSGTYIYPVILFYDKKTGITNISYMDYAGGAFFGSRVWKAMNDFICDEVDVWKDGRAAVYDDKTDWNKVKVTNFKQIEEDYYNHFDYDFTRFKRR